MFLKMFFFRNSGFFHAAMSIVFLVSSFYFLTNFKTNFNCDDQQLPIMTEGDHDLKVRFLKKYTMHTVFACTVSHKLG
jgi:hypothetical protein